MSDGIRVRIIPGCPAIVVAETEEDREAAEEALADVKCGVQVVTEEFAETLTEAAEAEEVGEAALAEAEGLVAEGKEGEALEVAEEALAALGEAPEELTCSLEPDKPWEESICGVVAKAAADDVMRRIRPSIERMGRVSEGGQA
ncbi:hypothetical protein ES703_93378 [subsurface metagenome]